MDKDTTKDTELLATIDGLQKTYGPDIPTVGFSPRKGRFGGRVKGSQNKRTKQALEICERLRFHPAAFLATVALTGLMPNPDGSTTPVSPEDRLRAATALAPFVMPRLQATQISGDQDAPIAVERAIDMKRILADPVGLRLMQDLSLHMTELDVYTLPAAKVGEYTLPAAKED